MALRNQDPQPYAKLGDACDLGDAIERCLGCIRVLRNDLNDIHAGPGLQVLRRAVGDFDAAIQYGQAMAAFSLIHVVC